MTARICGKGGEESNETPILISITPGDGGGGGGGGLSGVLLVVAVSVTLHVVMVVMVVVITPVLLTAAVILAGLIPAGFRGKELLGRAGQDVPVSLWGRRSGVPHGTRPVRRPRRRTARDGAALDGTARLKLGLLLFCGAGLRRVGDAAAGDRLLGGRRRTTRSPQVGLGVGLGLRAVSKVSHSRMMVMVRRRRVQMRHAAGEVSVVVVWHRGEARAALAEHGLREVGARLEGVLPYRILEKDGKRGNVYVCKALRKNIWIRSQT